MTIDVGKGVTNAKWIKLSGERRMGGRRSFYKFDFSKGEAIDGTQSALRAAMRPIRQPGVPDNAHLSMLRHVIEKKHPAVGILSIREAMRANARIQQLEHMATELIARRQVDAIRAGPAAGLHGRGRGATGRGARGRACTRSRQDEACCARRVAWQRTRCRPAGSATPVPRTGCMMPPIRSALGAGR